MFAGKGVERFQMPRISQNESVNYCQEVNMTQTYTLLRGCVGNLILTHY